MRVTAGRYYKPTNSANLLDNLAPRMQMPPCTSFGYAYASGITTERPYPVDN